MRACPVRWRRRLEACRQRAPSQRPTSSGPLPIILFVLGNRECSATPEATLAEAGTHLHARGPLTPRSSRHRYRQTKRQYTR